MSKLLAIEINEAAQYYSTSLENIGGAKQGPCYRYVFPTC